GERYGHVLARADLVPDDRWLDRQGGDEPFGQVSGAAPPCLGGRPAGAPLLHEPPAWPPARAPLGGRGGDGLAPEQRHRDLAPPRDAPEGRPQQSRPAPQGTASLIGVGERRPETDRQARRRAADALDDAVVVEEVVADDRVAGLPRRPPHAEPPVLEPLEHPAAKPRHRQRWRRGRRDGVGEEAHWRSRSTRSSVATDESTRLRPR